MPAPTSSREAAAAAPISSNEEYYYFCYGPVVDDLVRQRRDLNVDSLHAAYLPNYRLTFSIGGLANIVQRTGYEVHGLLMKLASREDWERLLSYDAGSTPSFHRVIPYIYDDPQQRREGDPRTVGEPVLARFVEFSGDVEDEFLDAPIEVLPQCRYLELIAKGMEKYRVDQDYIDAQIMATPFEPKRPPEEYRTVPLDCKHLASSSSSTGNMFPFAKQKMRRHKSDIPTDHLTPQSLPRITFDKYLQLCQTNSTEEQRAFTDVFFIVNDYVYRIVQPDITKIPMAKWLFRNGHGKQDVSLVIHKLIVDHDIPLCDSLEEMTPLHFSWVENHIVEQLLEMYHCECFKVAKISKVQERPSRRHVRSPMIGKLISFTPDASSPKSSRMRSMSPKAIRKSNSLGFDSNHSTVASRPCPMGTGPLHHPKPRHSDSSAGSHKPITRPRHVSPKGSIRKTKSFGSLSTIKKRLLHLEEMQEAGAANATFR